MKMILTSLCHQTSMLQDPHAGPQQHLRPLFTLPTSSSSCCRQDLEIFDDNYYTRVFLSRDSALQWWQHHRVLGSPSQAANVQQLLKRSRQRATQMIQNHNYLGALQALAVAAGAQLKHQSVVDLCRCGPKTLAVCEVPRALLHSHISNHIGQVTADL